MTRAAIIAALPGEVKPLVRGWQHVHRNGVHIWSWRHDEGEWVATCAGAGQDAATRAFAEVEKDGAISFVISTGWAGALSDEFKPGQVYTVSGVIDARTGERFRVATWSVELWLATSPKVADEQEKRRLATAYQAGLVDMEAASIARLAQMRNIPFNCMKGVSDRLSDRLPDFNRFISKHGQFKLSQFVIFALLHPRYWRTLIRMGENSKRAAQSIAESLLNFLDPKGEIRKRNGYPNFKYRNPNQKRNSR